jgi:hypothetical protein
MMWVVCCEDLDEIERISHCRGKFILTVLLKGSSQFLTDILPQGKKMNTVYFIDNIITYLGSLYYPQERRSYGHKTVLHIVNAPINNTTSVTERISSEELGKISNSSHGPDLALCNM